jgi:hypothetical protein
LREEQVETDDGPVEELREHRVFSWTKNLIGWLSSRYAHVLALHAPILKSPNKRGDALEARLAADDGVDGAAGQHFLLADDAVGVDGPAHVSSSFIAAKPSRAEQTSVNLLSVD